MCEAPEPYISVKFSKEFADKFGVIQYDGGVSFLVMTLDTALDRLANEDAYKSMYAAGSRTDSPTNKANEAGE